VRLFVVFGGLLVLGCAFAGLNGCSGVSPLIPDSSGANYVRVPGEFSTIQAAIDSSDSGSVILIAPGTYRENLELRGWLSLQGDGEPGEVVVDGAVSGSVVSLDNLGDASVTLRNLTLKNGSGHEPAGTYLPGTQGGAVWCFRSTVYIYDCRLLGNDCGGEGGAVYLSGATAEMEDCVFSGNHAGRNGGAVYSTGAFDPLAMRNCSFENNVAGGSGGAVYAERGRPVEVSGSLFWKNKATNDAGALGSLDTRMTIRTSTFVENIQPDDRSTVAITTCDQSEITLCIFAFNSGWAASVECLSFSHSCNCFHQNSGGTYRVGVLDATEFSVDPEFCNRATGDFRLRSSSPCLGREGCGTIGAFGGGC